MADYHKYVFDSELRQFVGRFEEMYQHEEDESYDSWHQDDSRQLNRKIALEILNGYNFDVVVDIGSGKGALTHCLKKRNNIVFGLDISPTAIKKARSRYPDIRFDVLDANDGARLSHFFDEIVCDISASRVCDLVFISECLSYLENWHELITIVSSRTRYIMIALYIPDNPIGFVRSAGDLEIEVSRFFRILEFVIAKQSRLIVIFAKSLVFS